MYSIMSKDTTTITVLYKTRSKLSDLREHFRENDEQLTLQETAHKVVDFAHAHFVRTNGGEANNVQGESASSVGARDST